MSNVIIYQNPNGPNVCVCIPTGELSVSEVLAKDCPTGAVVIDSASLPEADNDFFDAWRLVNGSVIVDLDAAKAVHLAKFNAEAAAQAVLRRNNADIGIPNTISDSDFVAMLNSKREAIAAATSTADLRAIGIN